MAILAVSERITKESVPLEIRIPPGSAARSNLEEIRADAERNRIRQVLEEVDWNISAAARTLGVERTRLHKRIAALGLSRDD